LEKSNTIRGIRLAKIIIWLCLPIIFWLIPVESFNNGPALCPSIILFNLECLGCGLTRATLYLHHLEISQAIAFNKLIIIIYPAIWLVYIHILGLILNKNWFGFLKNFY